MDGVTTHAEGQNTAPVDRDEVINYYEHELAKATWYARIVGALQGVTRFLGYCNLTWATVVLLGGFVSSLQPADFSYVTILLLLEAVRLASAIFFSRIVRRALITLSENPASLKQDDLQYRIAWYLRVLSQIGQVVFISPSIVLPILRLMALSHLVTTQHNLRASLKIFYIPVLINALVALLAVLCSGTILYCLYDPSEQSIQRYYDAVVQRAFDDGVSLADDFQFLEFAFTMLGRDFSRNVQPQVVQKHHSKLIDYIYANRAGLDMLLLCLDRDDIFVQRAAVSIVGFWADKKPLWLPTNILAKLADKLGSSQLGWAAANSFSLLAEEHPRTVLTQCSSGKRVVDILIEMIEPSSSRYLVFVRALVSFYQSSNEREILPDMERQLERKLRQMLNSSKRHRLRVLAGYLLMKMGNLKGNADDTSAVRNINPLKDDYFLKSEVIMLDELTGICKLSSPAWVTIEGTHGFKIREDRMFKRLNGPSTCTTDDPEQNLFSQQ